MAGVACGFLLASTLSAQTADYFPLEVGNIWLFKSVSIVNNSVGVLNITYQTIQVTGKEQIGNREYFDVSYFGRDVLLREEGTTGDVFVYNRETGAETPWVLLSRPVGGTFPSGLDQCTTQGLIVSRNGLVFVGTQDLPDVIQADFHGPCADAGVTRQYYAPNVGLIRQEQTTFAGPLVYRLIYYHAGVRTDATQEVSFTVALDSPWYFSGGLLGARLTLRNTKADAVNLHFPSSQSFDLKILNDKGEAVFVWSSSRSFAQVVRDEKLAPGELTYGASVLLDGFPAGHYVLQAYLTTNPIEYVAQVPFDVVTVGIAR